MPHGEAALTRLVAAFDPQHPLGEDETGVYVDWQQKLGGEDVKRALVRSFILSGEAPIVGLLTGHRGVGKTTELHRVAALLRSGDGDRRFFVAFLEGEKWLDLGDVSGEEIAFQMVRQLVSDLKAEGMQVPKDFGGAFGERLKDFLKALDPKVEANFSWLKVSLGLRDMPSLSDHRRALREVLQGNLPSLFDDLNRVLLPTAREFLKTHGYDGIILVVDDLDKVPLRVSQDGETSHVQLFINEAPILQALACDVLLTVPIELAYSGRQRALVERYGGRLLTLPAIAVRDRTRAICDDALDQLRQVFVSRCEAADVPPAAVFENDNLLDEVLRSTGGHVRSIPQAIRSLVGEVDHLPITADTVRVWRKRERRDMLRALAGDSANRAVIEQVADDGVRPESDRFFSLLRDGYVLAYMDDDDDWYWPHPWLGFGDD